MEWNWPSVHSLCNAGVQLLVLVLVMVLVLLRVPARGTELAV